MTAQFKTTKRSETIRIEGPSGETLAISWCHASETFLVRGEKSFHESDKTIRPCRQIVLIPDCANGVLVRIE